MNEGPNIILLSFLLTCALDLVTFLSSEKRKKTMLKKLTVQHIFMCLIFVYLMASAVAAQTTPFSYQGKLTNAGNPANATYDMQFSLFDAVMGGAQIGSTLTQTAVQVTNGIFTVQLDFGANVFDGTARYLEIGVRPSGNADPHPLNPRLPITSTPCAIRSLTAGSALQLGGVDAARFVQSDAAGNVSIGGNLTVGRLHAPALSSEPIFFRRALRLSLPLLVSVGESKSCSTLSAQGKRGGLADPNLVGARPSRCACSEAARLRALTMWFDHGISIDNVGAGDLFRFRIFQT